MFCFTITLTSVFEMSLTQLMFQWGLAFKELIDLGELTVRKGLGLPFPNSGQL